MTRATMKNIKHFSLIEILTVMIIAIAVMTIMIPSARKLTRGNRVDELASAIKLGLEQAQVQALSRRTYVAVIFPDNRSTFAEAQWEDICLGGFRLAEVTQAGAFVRWTDAAAEWHKRPEGALLAKVALFSDTDFATGSNSNELAMIQENSGITQKRGNTPVISSFGATYSNTVLHDITGIPDEFATSATTRTGRGIIFGPYGDAQISNANLVLYVAGCEKEGFGASGADGAVSSNYAQFSWPSQDGNGPTNYRALRLRKFSGKVEYVQ